MNGIRYTNAALATTITFFAISVLSVPSSGMMIYAQLTTTIDNTNSTVQTTNNATAALDPSRELVVIALDM